MMAVLQGLDVVSFPYLWPCQFALGGQPCHFCYQGNMTLALRQASQPLPPIASPDDVAEAVEYCVRREGVRDVQLTGGSEVDSACGEVPQAVDILAAIDRGMGLDNIPGEIYAYAPGLDYYRRARRGFAELFARYKLQPPGASGLNVCMCRDLSVHQSYEKGIPTL